MAAKLRESAEQDRRMADGPLTTQAGRWRTLADEAEERAEHAEERARAARQRLVDDGVDPDGTG